MEWLVDNGIVLSLSKSKLLVTCTRKLRRAKEVPTNLQTLRATYSEKLLGMVLNLDFCWDTHLWGRLGMTKITALDWSHNSQKGGTFKKAGKNPPPESPQEPGCRLIHLQATVWVTSHGPILVPKYI